MPEGAVGTRIRGAGGSGHGGGGRRFPSVFPLEVSMRCAASVWQMLTFSLG